MGLAKFRAPVRVRDVLVAAVPELRERMLEDAIRRDWAQTVGPEIARRSDARELRMGVLSVTVDNSPWLQELTLRSGELLQALQSRHGRAVSALRFSLGEVSVPAPRPARRRRPDADVPLDGDEASRVDGMVAAVADAALGASLRRLLTKDLIARRGSGPSRHRPDRAPTEKEDS